MDVDKEYFIRIAKNYGISFATALEGKPDYTLDLDFLRLLEKVEKQFPPEDIESVQKELKEAWESEYTKTKVGFGDTNHQ